MTKIDAELRQHFDLLMRSFNGVAPFVIAVVDHEHKQLLIASNIDDMSARITMLEATLEATKQEPAERIPVPAPREAAKG